MCWQWELEGRLGVLSDYSLDFMEPWYSCISSLFIIFQTSFESNLFHFLTQYPYPFDSMLSVLSIFALDFLNLGCIAEGSPSQRYFTTIYMWSYFPMIVCVFIAIICMLRLHRLSKLSISSDMEKIDVINQHIWYFLLFTYLILPPVANKQFQSLDW